MDVAAVSTGKPLETKLSRRAGSDTADLVRATLRLGSWYLLGVLGCAALGIESIYGHVTPFHALFIPANETWGAPILAVFAAIGLVAATAGLTGFIRPRPRTALMGFAAACGAVALAGLLDWYRLRAPSGEVLGVWIREAARHAPALGAFGVTVLAGLLFLRRANWFERDLEPETARRAVIALMIFAFCFAGAIAMIRGGTDGIAAAYSRTGYEYVDDIGKGLTMRGLLRDYNSMHEHLSMHARVHPPGLILILWVLSYVVMSREALPLSLATMAVGCLAMLPLYAWARDLFGSRRAAVAACAVYGAIPSIVLFTATSADILLMPITFAALYWFWRAIHHRSAAGAVGAGIMYAALSLCSFSHLTIGAFFGIVGLWRLFEKERRAAVVQTAFVMLAVFFLVHAAVRIWSGFDVIECFRLSKAQFDEDQAQLDIVSPRYAGWVFWLLNPLCWIFFAGLPVSVLFFRSVLRRDGAARDFAAQCGLTLIVLTALYLARGEGERSAMYVLPFILMPAAWQLDQLGVKTRSHAPLLATLAILAAQSWGIETLLFTYW